MSDMPAYVSAIPVHHTALDFGLTSVEVAVKAEVTRGDLAVMLYRALGNTDASSEHQGETLSRNADGSINPPADGSQYIPQVGDVTNSAALSRGVYPYGR